MKILVVTTSYPRHGDDAAGGFVAARVQTLLDARHQVQVIAAGDGGAGNPGAGGGGPAVFRVPPLAGAPLFYGAGAPEQFDAQPARAWLSALGFFAALVTALRSRLGAADAVESHWLIPSALAVVALGHRGPHRAHAHSGDVALLEVMPGGAAVAARLLAARITLVFASADLRARFAQLVARSGAGPAALAQVLGSAVAAAESPLCRNPPAWPGRAERRLRAGRRGLPGPVVLSIGRLVPIKGHDRLVRAASRLALPAHQRPVVVILGEGPERPRLQLLAAQRGLDLRLPGQVGPSAVADWLGLADVVVHPSRVLGGGRSEGMPVAVREALLAGLPVIATATGGMGELADIWPGQLRLLPEEPAAGFLPALAGALVPLLL